MPDKRIHGGSLLAQDDYKPGDQPPQGCLAWHEWAEVQHKAGLRQKQCEICCKWKYPQELSDKTVAWSAISTRGENVDFVGAVCNDCAALQPNTQGNRTNPRSG